jgi:hypothetical protein
MKIPVPELVVASLVFLAIISVESGSIAGMIGASTKAGERFTGTWTSYSPTRFGATSVEFFANGTCQFRAGAGEAFFCKWREAENGQAKIDATASGRAEVFSASMAGDYLVIKEPGRETPYVRSDSKAAHAHERQSLLRGSL